MLSYILGFNTIFILLLAATWSRSTWINVLIKMLLLIVGLSNFIMFLIQTGYIVKV